MYLYKFIYSISATNTGEYKVVYLLRKRHAHLMREAYSREIVVGDVSG